MCQIMFYYQLPASDTIHRWTLAPEAGWFHIGAFTDVEPGHWGGHQVSGHGVKSCFIINCQLLPHSQVDPCTRSGLVPHRGPHRCGTWTLGWTPSVRSKSQCVTSCFIINCQLLPLFISVPGSRSRTFPLWCPHQCETRTLGRTPSVRPWSQCVKSCFIINCQLLLPFTGGPWFQK